MPYIGNTVQTQGFTPAIDYFSGNGVTVTFTLTRPVVSVAQMIVVIDNVPQNPSSSYTVSGSSITFSSAPLAGTNNIWVEYTSLITTYAAISQSPSVIGDITASGGYLAVGSFGNTFIDGTIVDYVTGNGRITTGPADGLTIYNGGTSARTALAAWDASGNLTNTGGAVIQGLTVGKGTASLRNTVVGQSALPANTTGVGGTYIGYQTGYTNTTGTANTFIGEQSGYFNTTGSYNTGVGQGSYASNSTTATGSYNTSLGALALYNNTTASYNTAVGYQAGYSNTTGSGYNVFIGAYAGYTNSTGSSNTFIGQYAGYSTTGTGNCFIGGGSPQSSGYYVTTGSKNTILGGYNGNQGGLDIRTASNYIVLSDGDGNPRLISNGSGQVTVGSNISGTPQGNLNIIGATSTKTEFYMLKSGQVEGHIGFVSGASDNWYFNTGPSLGTYGLYQANNSSSWSSNSDERLKTDLVPIENGLEKVASLRSVTGRYKVDPEGTSRAFLIAQDIQAVLPEAITKTHIPDDETEYLGVGYTDVIPLLVSAIKELKAEVDALKAQLEAK